MNKKFDKLALLALVAQAVALFPVYDGGEGGGDDDDAAKKAAEVEKAKKAAEDAKKSYNQPEVEKMMEAERKKYKEQMQKLETQLAGLAQNNQLSEAERNELNASLEDVRKQLRTKEQQAAIDKQNMEAQYKQKLTEAETQAKQWEGKYVDTTIRRSLSDAAALGDAFSTTQVVELLRSKTKMVNDQPMVDFPDRHAETGEEIIIQLSPTDAVKRMKELPEAWGNLFKSNVASGIGGSSKVDGSQTGGKVDVKKLTPAEYARLRKENPRALGLR